MSSDPLFTPPAKFTAGSTFWKLQSDGRNVWVDDDGLARDAIGLVVPVAEVLKEGVRGTEKEFRLALVLQDRSSPLRLPSGEFIGGRKLKLAHYAIPPVTARGDPPWASRSVRLFPVLDHAGAQVAEVWFAWKDGAWHMGRSVFINSFEERIRYDDCGRLSLAAEERDWATLDAFHPEALPWFCRTCECNYPEKSWHVFERSDDDEDGFVWLDSHRGKCPHGHERMIAD